MKDGRRTDKVREELKENLLRTTERASKVFVVRIASQGASLVAGLVYARFLGADLYGVFQLALTMVSILSLLTAFGMSPGLIRYIPIFKSESKIEAIKGMINFALTFAFSLSTLTALFLFFGRDFVATSIFNEPRLSGIIAVFCFVLIFYSLASVLGGVIQAEGEAHVFIFFRFVLDNVVSVVLFLSFYFLMGARLSGISTAKLLSAGIIVFLAGKWVRRRFPFLWKRPFFFSEKRKEFVTYSASLLFISFTYFLMNQVNNLIIGVYTVSKEVGFYSVGNMVASLVAFVFTSFNIIFAPMISELYHKKRYETLENMYSAITRLIWIFTLPIFLWVVIFSRNILYLFGPEFVAAKWVLTFLAIGQFVNAAVGPNGIMLAMSGHQKWEMFNGVAVAILNIMLNLLLIPRYGALGSAIGGAIALAVVNIAKTLEVWYVMKMIPYNTKFVKPILAGIAGAIGLSFLKNFFKPDIVSTFAAGGIGGVIIIGTILLLGLEEEDRILLEALKNKIFSQFKARP